MAHSNTVSLEVDEAAEPLSNDLVCLQFIYKCLKVTAVMGYWSCNATWCPFLGRGTGSGGKCWRRGRRKGEEASVEAEEVERGGDNPSTWPEAGLSVVGNYRVSWLAPATHHLLKLQTHTHTHTHTRTHTHTHAACPLSGSVIETAAIQLPDSRRVSSSGADEEKIIHFKVLDPPLCLLFVFFLTFSFFPPISSVHLC